MKKIDNNELRSIQIEILDVVADFCDENEINYWIDGGTLLGAIRHKGYIPWDDDIDIGMLRADYNRFVKLFNLENTRYHLECIENNKYYHLPFGKVVDTNTILYEPDENGFKFSINVDIFVYDNAPNDDIKVKYMYCIRDFLRANYYLQTANKSIRGSLIKSVLAHMISKLYRLVPSNYFLTKMIENSKRYEDKNVERVGNFVGWSKIMCSKSVFDSFIDVEFEGKKYKAPVGYDEWLRSFYGDYMQLPPEEKRVTHHSFVAYI